jgi:hypothetical protein
MLSRAVWNKPRAIIEIGAVPDTQPADVNVGYGARSLDNPMSAIKSL